MVQPQHKPPNYVIAKEISSSSDICHFPAGLVKVLSHSLSWVLWFFIAWVIMVYFHAWLAVMLGRTHLMHTLPPTLQDGSISGVNITGVSVFYWSWIPIRGNWGLSLLEEWKFSQGVSESFSIWVICDIAVTSRIEIEAGLNSSLTWLKNVSLITRNNRESTWDAFYRRVML